MQRLVLLLLALAATTAAADLPVRDVVLYKHGVGYFQRSGTLAAGETAQLDFKAGDMNDVLKSLTIVDAAGNAVAGVRYDASEPVQRRLQDFPFAVGDQVSLAAFLDQMKGARLELRIGPDTLAGTIVSARLTRVGDAARATEQQLVVLLTDAGDIRSLDLGAASAVRLTDPKLQDMLRDYLTVLSGARSRDRRSVYIDSSSTASRQITASYMTPAAVWKSSYRLLFGPPTGGTAQPTLEGWAIVDNTSGDDWTNVNLSVVSGRPISFVSQLYEPRYVDRPTAELAENRAVAPPVFEGGIIAGVPQPSPAAAARQQGQQGQQRAGQALDAFEAQAKGGGGGFRPGVGGAVSAAAASTIAAAAEGRDLGELFEYRFDHPVTVKQGESAMLPFLQQKVDARKLLIYTESFGLHPMNSAEITNNTGKTLDGGPITVYDAASYAGEALVETLKAGDKRLISYGVDLGARVTTQFDSSSAVVREIHFRRGVLTTRSAIQETKTYTIANVDPERKTVIIQHPKRPGYELLENLKPKETTSDAYRFEVVVGGKATETFAVREERVFNQSYGVSNLTPDLLSDFIQNRALSAQGRMQLDAILAKKREIAENDAQLKQAQTDLRNLSDDENRIRQNISSLRNVAGQESQVQQYARQLSTAESQIATLRDREAELSRAQSTLQSELDTLIENADF